jgi:hypothetical protein
LLAARTWARAPSTLATVTSQPRGRGRVGVAALAATALLAGCGDSVPSANGLSRKTPAQIVAAARAAATSAATVRVAGSILDGSTPIFVHMELVAGKGGQGQVALEGFSVKLVDVDNSLYINSGAAFYERFAGRAAARRLQGKWLKGSARGALRALSSLTSLPALLGAALDAHGPLSRAPGATVAGQSAVAVSDREHGGTLYVASTGTPYPLAIVRQGAHPLRLEFEEWNQAVTLEPPVGAINIKQLEKRR